MSKTTKNRSYLTRIVRFGARFIDYKMGVMGAIVMAGIVFIVNYYSTFNITGASTAALKQGSYTFLFGGIIMRGCEYLAVRIPKQVLALIAATLIPSTVAICLTFGVHSMKGTPRPVESTIPTAIFVIPSTVIWGYRKRKIHRLDHVIAAHR